MLVLATRIFTSGLLSHFDGNHPASDRPQRNGGDFKVGDAYRDADNADALGDAGGNVRQAQPPAEEDQPEHIEQRTAGGKQGIAFSGYSSLTLIASLP